MYEIESYIFQKIFRSAVEIVYESKWYPYLNYLDVIQMMVGVGRVF